MKLSDIKKVSERIEKGYDFEPFPGSGVIATVVPIDSNKRDINITKEFVKYFKKTGVKSVEEIPDEDLEKIRSYAMIYTCILDVKGIKDDEDNDIEWNYELVEQIIEEGGFSGFLQSVFTYIQNITLGGVAYKVDDNTKKK